MVLRKGFVLSALFLFGSSVSIAQSPSTASMKTDTAGDHLRLVVVLSRHGVRSPTWTLDRLNTYSSQPWPAWSVEPGILTARGADLLKHFGSYDRASYAGLGLFSAKGCADAAKTFVWADTDQRTIASGHALAESLFPGCDLKVHSLAENENDPVFHPLPNPTPAMTEAAMSQLTKRVADLPSAPTDELLQQMQRILLGCKPDTDCTPKHTPEAQLLDGKTGVAPGKGDKAIGIKGPIPTGSSFSEDLLLEYAEGMLMRDVGWGNVDEAEIGRLIGLHTVYFDLIHKTPALAKTEASNMLSTITKTLEQGVEGKSVQGAKGNPGDKLVLLVGHDTNIGGVQSLLGLHWKLDGRDDDTPPGTELAFELWQNAKGKYSVRVKVVMQTLHQLRENEQLTATNPPANLVVSPRGCSQQTSSCSWQEFRTLSMSATTEESR
jgi:4-phytase/acid phosphatase